MDVLRLGDELELQLQAYATDIAMPDLSCICDWCCSLWQFWVFNLLNEARDQTHILMDTNWVRNLLSHNRTPRNLFFFFFCFFLCRSPPHNPSPPRGQIGMVDASRYHSHRNARSKPCLQPTPQLMAVPDPLIHWTRPGIKPPSSRILVRFVTAEPCQKLLHLVF